MFKKMAIIFCAALLITPLFSAEVSKKKEIAVLPVYSSYELPSGAALYFDDTMIAILSRMARFQVIGYHYRLDATSAEKFIQKIQELKKESLMKSPEYMDVDLGVVVIPANEMERLVNSFFVFVPSITGFHTREYKVEVKVKRGNSVKVTFETEYEAIVNVSIKIITADGKLLDTYNASEKSTSRKNMMEAYQTAINNAISGLSFFLRNVEEFKIKSQVINLKGNEVYLELGGNLGIRPGYEFFIQKEEKFMGKFTDKITTGLLRVKEIRNEYSIATIIYGDPQIGDQLVEAPIAGGRFNIWAGMLPMNIPSDNLLIKFSNSSISFESSEKFSKSSYAFALGFNLEGEIGYALLSDLRFTAFFNNPFALGIDLGLGYELYLGRMSITAGADLSFIGLSKYLGRIDNENFWGIKIENKTFYDDIDVSLFGGTFGIRPNISFNFQVNQRFKIRGFVNYGFYFLPYYTLEFKEIGGSDDENKVSLPISDPNVSIEIDGKKVSTFPIDFSGPGGGIEIIFRF